MVLPIKNFGDILMSRTAGREASFMAEEFIFGIKSEYPNNLQYINTENPSVKASLKTVLKAGPN